MRQSNTTIEYTYSSKTLDKSIRIKADTSTKTKQLLLVEYPNINDWVLEDSRVVFKSGDYNKEYNRGY